MQSLKLLDDRDEFLSTGSLNEKVRLFAKGHVFDIAVLLICFTSFGFSWIESIVNRDGLHWGLMYGPALDLERGALPHSGTLIAYGYLTTWLQSIALMVFGDKLLNIGIVTGLFYSLTFFLSYRVFLRFMPKQVAFVAVVLIFLIHPYIIYPWSNYFEYTFELLALIFFLRYSKNRYNGFLSGVFLAMSLLSRYSSAIAILPPFLILLGWEFFHVQGSKKTVVEKVILIGSGFIIPLLAFVVYLAVNSSLDDFFFQNRMIMKEWGRSDQIEMYISFVNNIIPIQRFYGFDVRIKIFTFILIVNAFVLIWKIVRSISGKTERTVSTDNTIAAVCLISLFGYLNAMHIYEVFRLANGSSLGAGIGVLVGYKLFLKTNKTTKHIMAFLVVFMLLSVAGSRYYKRTTPSYFPWQIDILLEKGVTNKTIGIFKGKLLIKEYNGYYQAIYDAIAPFKNSHHIINYSGDCVAFLMNDLPRAQLSPYYLPGVEDSLKLQRIIDQKAAVIISEKVLEIPGYAEIFRKKIPDQVIHYNDWFYIYAPKR